MGLYFFSSLKSTDGFFSKGFTTAVLKSDGTSTQASDSFRMLVMVRRRFMYLLFIEVQKWGVRECELTGVNVLRHSRKAVSDRDNSVFEQVTENAGYLLEIMDRRKRRFACFAYQSSRVVKQLFARHTRRHHG